jgi:hypothetical protein
MKMIRPLNRQSIKAANFIPAATVDRPTTWFRDRGVEFHHGQDDLDAYEFAGVNVSGLSVGLLRYANAPLDETTLLVPDKAVLGVFVDKVAREFDLSVEHFHWRHAEPLGQPSE